MPSSWLDAAATSTASYTISADDAWRYWNATATTNSSVWLNDHQRAAAWQAWLAEATAITSFSITTPASTAAAGPRGTPQPAAQDPQALARVAELEAQRLAAQAERAAAEGRAEALLLAHLTPAQKAQYHALGTIPVVTPAGRQYELRKHRAGNVRAITPQGGFGARYCIHPREPVPVADILLAQLLLLAHDEDTFLRVANRSAA